MEGLLVESNELQPGRKSHMLALQCQQKDRGESGSLEQ